MGCWDIFCFLCGNTCHPISKDIELELKDLIEFYEKVFKNKKYKWFIEHFGPVYSSYKADPVKFISKLKKLKAQTKWLDKCTFLCADNKIIHGCKEVNCNIGFIDKTGNYYNHETVNSDHMINYGVFVHSDCWKYVLKTFKVKLNYSYLPILNVERVDSKLFKFIKYGSIEKYWEQDFNFLLTIANKEEELCSSPFVTSRVASNIKKVWSKLKIRTDKSRKSPGVSASFYKPGYYKVGLNGNIWTIKSGKWVELADTEFKTITYDVNKIPGNLVGIADVNTKPIFVKSVKPIKAKQVQLEIITANTK